MSMVRATVTRRAATLVAAMIATLLALTGASSSAIAAEDESPPVLSDVRMTPKVFHNHGPGRPRLSFSVSEDALVKVTLVRRGVQRGCSAHTCRLGPARGPRARIDAEAGRTEVALRGNLRKSNLRPGRYRLEVRAIDDAGQRDRAASFFRVRG